MITPHNILKARVTQHSSDKLQGTDLYYVSSSSVVVTRMGPAPDDDASRSGAQLAVVAQADWLQGHATETAKMRQIEERESAERGG